MTFDSHDLTTIIAAIIGGFFLLSCAVTAVVLPVLLSIRKSAKRTETQVTNDHPTNLREENDERHAENAERLDTMLRLQRAQARRLGTMDRRVTRLAKRMGEVEEATMPRNEVRKRTHK